ncbi:MAG: hypothetical protein ACOX8R_10000 [Bacillota bacterium]
MFPFFFFPFWGGCCCGSCCNPCCSPCCDPCGGCRRPRPCRPCPSLRRR